MESTLVTVGPDEITTLLLLTSKEQNALSLTTRYIKELNKGGVLSGHIIYLSRTFRGVMSSEFLEVVL